MTTGEQSLALAKDSQMLSNMRLAARIALVFMFALYWGGLTFYTGIVVRIIHMVLNDPMDGGLITQKVTFVLQVLGACTLPLMLVNDLSVARHSKRLGIALFGLTLVLSCALIALFVVHSQLDQLIDAQQMEITDRLKFDAAHRWYNQSTTVQWLAAVTYLPLAVYSWRVTDSACSPQ
ncbi:MAG: hypothetical protein GY924_06825 [Planctomycetaceae bacterium]|nr:hypothetical protein [Planctomycetaceae bacterium]